MVEGRRGAWIFGRQNPPPDLTCTDAGFLPSFRSSIMKRVSFFGLVGPLLLSFVAISSSAPAVRAQDRAERVRNDLRDFLARGLWIYNDLEKGFSEARKSGKPLLVVLRCIPCEACRGFDEQVAELDPRIRPLLDKFVRVRIPQTNHLDLSVFQFDYDLSFYAFFFHPGGAIYGRFGSRSTQEDKKGEVSIDAFAEALRAVLALHERYSEVKDSLAAKKGPKPLFPVPEKFPSLEGRYGPTLDYEGKVVQSCIHCHQIRDAERQLLRSEKRLLSDEVLFPFPSPSVLGIELDPRKRATVQAVADGSVAAQAGFRPGDELVSLEGQPLVSISDVEWVLQHAGDKRALRATVRRDGASDEDELELPLPEGWRTRGDISWRVSTWDLRRMGTGGMRLEEIEKEEREKLGIDDEHLALRAKHVGEYGEHATAKRAGLQKGDVIIAVDGDTQRRSESRLIAYTMQEKRPGDRIEFVILRNGERKEFSFDVR